ncbi:hypothetical protein YTPLAS18_17670 [Nitrospira sp.]|nr:hypothetical protein YTPLAS18_17670 [Nitrospira sp.]
MRSQHVNAAFYYPFHLCHPRTLETLLHRFQTIHFRDYMALQLTPMSGTTAYQDRMGDRFPDLVAVGRIVQGHNVNGRLPDEVAAVVNRDLLDDAWRRLVHDALQTDRRFQRGLFDISHSMTIGKSTVPGPAALLKLTESSHAERSYSIADVARLSRPTSLDEGYAFEYGMALVKTSAALTYTIKLAGAMRLVAVTDSATHFALLTHTCEREGTSLSNHLVDREGY